MKTVIINGSPKGKTSMTRYCVKLIKREYTDPEYVELFVAKRIIRLEKNDAYWNQCLAEIKSADLIIWAFPVYVFAAPSQILRFVELVHERGCQDVFAGKYATAITTSGNFYDHTAQRYIHEVSEELDMHFYEGFSGNMFELTNEEVQRSLLRYAEDCFRHVQERIPLPKRNQPLVPHDLIYQPTDVKDRPKQNNKQLLIVTDVTAGDKNLQQMIDTFIRSVEFPVKVTNLHDLDIKGGCTGCAKCLDSAQCVYNDVFESFYKEHLASANGIIYATTIQQRYFSSKLKQYFDRGFVNGHRPSLVWKFTGYLISGTFKGLSNLQDILYAKSQTGETPLVGIVTDECSDSDELIRSITAMAENAKRLLDESWIRPPTFLGIGGHKVLRDMIYEWKDLMSADHRYYEEQGLYDFPNK